MCGNKKSGVAWAYPHVISCRTEPLIEEDGESRNVDYHKEDQCPWGGVEGLQEGCEQVCFVYYTSAFSRLLFHGFIDLARGHTNVTDLCEKKTEEYCVRDLPVGEMIPVLRATRMVVPDSRKGDVKSTAASRSELTFNDVRTMSNFFSTNSAISPFHLPFCNKKKCTTLTYSIQLKYTHVKRLAAERCRRGSIRACKLWIQICRYPGFPLQHKMWTHYFFSAHSQNV